MAKHTRDNVFLAPVSLSVATFYRAKMASPSTAGRTVQLVSVLFILLGISAITLQSIIVTTINRLLYEIDTLPTEIDYLGLSIVNGTLVAILGLLGFLAVRRPTRFLSDVCLGYAILTLATSAAVSAFTVFQMGHVSTAIAVIKTCTWQCGLWYQLEVALSAIDIAAFLFSAVLIFLLAIRLRHQLYLPVEQIATADKIMEDSHLINSPMCDPPTTEHFYCNECMKEVTATRFRFD